MEKAKETLGQSPDLWTNEWDNLSPESEIKMWDYFGVRPWVLKYTPRFGKVLEAGCGLGRYNFYLSHFGVETIGLDFSEKTISFLKEWQKKYGYNLEFIEGDVTELPYEDNSIAGYLSFGVVEHFIEGPHRPLQEAFRVLRPGGIAIITTPNKSWAKFINKSKSKLIKFIKFFLGKRTVAEPFFQYEYSPAQLRNFVAASGLKVSEFTGADHLFAFLEWRGYKAKNIFDGSFAHKISPWLDNSALNKFGAQSITISIKVADIMHCFFCGELKAKKNCLDAYTVPVCDVCLNDPLSDYYKIGSRTYFHDNYSVNPPVHSQEKRTCTHCSKEYFSNVLFEDFGLKDHYCLECLSEVRNSLLLSNTSITPIWRRRK